MTNCMVGAGKTALLAGAGDDWLYGGYEHDTYVFTDGWGVDTVSDPGDETHKDTFDLSAVMANLSIRLNFNFGQQSIRVRASGGNSITETGYPRIEEFLAGSGTMRSRLSARPGIISMKLLEIRSLLITLAKLLSSMTLKLTTYQPTGLRLNL